MTEDEARKLWCPFARVIHFHDNDGLGQAPAAGNRGCHGDPKTEARCIASDCMAWRWNSNYDHSGDSTAAMQNRRNGYGGYCGLAGNE